MNVFISYAISDKVTQTIDNLRQVLHAKNINVWLDTDVQTPQGPEEGWIKWMRDKIRNADWVLIFFDDKYRRRYDGEAPQDEGLGATYEGCIISQELYVDHGRNRKFIPLLEDGAPIRLLPEDFRAATIYQVPRQSAELANALRANPRPPQKPKPKAGAKFNLNGLQPLATTALIGRLQVKDEIFDAFEDEAVGVLAIIADGGIGKTAVVFDWLTRLNSDRYNLKHIYAWPFFDRLKRRYTTSADFFINAFEHFGHVPVQKDINVPEDKADSLQQIFNSCKAILVLDGLEDLQKASVDKFGELEDQAINKFLQNQASHCWHQAERLVIVTSRLPVLDLQGVPGYHEIHLKPLRKSSGAQLLSQLGVRGSEEELELASSEYGGHCLSLVLLGKIIANWFPDAHIVNRHEVSSIVPDPFPDTSTTQSTVFRAC